MKLPHTLVHRPRPQMPTLAGFEPRFDPIPSWQIKQPEQVLRPLYWWATELRRHEAALLSVHFDPTQMAARVVVRLSSYRVMEVERRNDHTPARPHDVSSLLAEAAWRLGVLGWAPELDELLDLLSATGLMSASAPIRQYAAPIPGWVWQPDRGVRIAYWWALALLRHGWQLHACGQDVAQYGFIAEIPADDGEATLVVYPGDMAADGTEAAALANHLARLGNRQRRLVQRIVSDSVTGRGRVI